MAPPIKKWAIPDDWTESDGWKIVAFCIPDSRGWRTIVRGLVNSLTYGRLWDEDTGSIRDTLTIAREIDGSYCMTCLDFSELAAAINNLAQNMGNNNSNCDCPQMGVVCVDTADIQPDGTQNPPDIPGDFGPAGDEYPEGFDSLEDYLAYKCEAAHFVMDALINVLRGVAPAFVLHASAATIAAILTPVLAGAGIGATIPPLAFLAIVSALVGMLFLGFEFFNVLNSLADELDANRQQIICRLYQAKNTIEAIEDGIDEVEDIIETVVIGSAIPAPFHAAAQTALTEVVTELWNTSLMNNLFQLAIDISYAGADCSECGQVPDCLFSFGQSGEPPITHGSGTFLYTGEAFTLNSVELSPGVHFLGFSVADLCTACDPPINWCVQFVATNLNTSIGGGWTRELFCIGDECSGLFESDYTGSFPPLSTDFSLASAQFSNPDAFAVTMRILGQLPPCSAAPLAQGCGE